MKGVKFGNYHSFDQWGLILSKHEIGSPKVKEKKIDIEGADGEIDYTEYFGSVKYGNRQLKFEFTIAMLAKPFIQKISDIMDAVHGQKMKVVLDDDPDWCYTGRVNVSDFTNSEGIGKITIEVDAEPYKLKKTVTKVTQAVTGSKEIILTNSRKTVVPKITATAAMTFAFGGTTYSAGAGTYIIPELQLKEGSNVVAVTGNGTVTFEYTEGRL